MQFTSFTLAALAASLASAQVLNVPVRVGTVQRASNARISANRDFGMAEFDSGITCDDETKGPPVFILDDGVTIENLIIGPNQIDGNILPTLLLGNNSLTLCRYPLPRPLYSEERLVQERLRRCE